MAPEDDLGRRHDDRDRIIHARLGGIEREYEVLRTAVTSLENTSGIIKLEQSHMKDLLDARLRMIEKGHELLMSKIEQVSRDIQTMGNDVDKSPVGRTLSTAIDTVQEACKEHDKKLTDIRTWQDQVNGVLLLLKWMGAGGLISLGLVILRAIHVIP